MSTVLTLFGVFAGLSLLAFGGGKATLPAVERRAVHEHDWVGASTFVHLYALGSVAPGPSTMYVAGIGYVAAGVPGGIAAGLGYVLPSSIAVVVAGSAWERWRESPWKLAIRDGLAPVIVGLLAAGAYKLAVAERPQVHGVQTVLAVGVAAIVGALALRGRLSPAILVLGAGLAGMAVLR
jgi:chromate transporter